MVRFKSMGGQIVGRSCALLGAVASVLFFEAPAIAQAPPPNDAVPVTPPPGGPPPVAPGPAPQDLPPAPPPPGSATSAPPVASAPPPTAPAEAAPEKAADPFAFGDFTWLNGSNRQHKALLDSDIFTGSFLLDVNYTASTNNPIDNTVVGSTALSRNNEFTLAFMGFGGDFHYKNARARLMTQFGVRSTLV
ncbi:MAG TPA: hypothetical protein VK841_26195, partial [Polyangiaceae bacterium]|nr:hypothetical protein [Polyangiaceae bacterium]